MLKHRLYSSALLVLRLAISRASVTFHFLHSALSYHVSYPQDMTTAATSAFQARFHSLDSLADSFRESLQPINQLALTTPSAVRTVLVTHSLAHMSIVQLHAFLSEISPHSQQKAVLAAVSVFKLLSAVNLQSFVEVNPILVSIWMRACQILIAELTRLRTLTRSPWTPKVSVMKEGDLVVVLESGFAALSMFSRLGGQRHGA